MTNEDQLHGNRHEAKDTRRPKTRARGRRAQAAEALEAIPSFEDYASERLWSFRCAQLATVLVAYLVMVVGDAWLHVKPLGDTHFAWAAPVLAMAAALGLTLVKGNGVRASIAVLVFIAALETGLVVLYWQYGTLVALPAFVLIPLAFSPVLQRGWDFPLAALFSIAGPLTLLARQRVPVEVELADVLSLFVALFISVVTNLFARRLQEKSFRLEHQLRAYADIDDLTLLPRRRRIFELGRQMLQRAERAGKPFSVLYIDADHFKLVNDRFGHDAGDRALRLIAHHIQESMRSYDVAGRFGGEEFVALLPDTDQADAERVAERLRKRIEDIRQFEVMLTLSIGVAQHVHGEQIDRVIRRADMALLAAKDGGRNRVVIAEPRGPAAPAAAAPAGAAYRPQSKEAALDENGAPPPSEWLAD